MTRYCYIYSEQELTPRAADTITKIKTENGWDDVTFIQTKEPPQHFKRVLVFGSRAPEGIWNGIEFVHTYSVAQIMAKANAVTVLDAALKMYFNGKHEPTIDAELSWCVVLDVDPKAFSFEYDYPVAIDIETDGNLGKTHTPEEVNIISIAMYDGREIPVVWVNPAEDGTCLPLSEEQLEMFREELPKYTKAIYHNGKFDTRVMNRVLGVELNVWFDTMLAHHVLNIAAGEHGLKILAQRYLGAEDWEDGIKQFLKGGGHYERIPYEKISRYNGWDVYWTYELWKLFEPQIDADENNQMAFELEMAAARMLLRVEKHGIPFSVVNAQALISQQTYIMEMRRAGLRKLTLRSEFNPNSPQQVKNALAEWGIHVASTNEETITELKDRTESIKVQNFCELLLEYRKASKIKSTYAEGWSKNARPDDTGQWRVHPTFLVHGTSTGRLSSTGPNAQNMPRNKDVRKIVALDKGEW